VLDISLTLEYDKEIFVIASSLDFLDSKLRGTSPQLRSSDSARKREWAQAKSILHHFRHCENLGFCQKD
ncbi:hypothetical protein, partial [Helicobacter sp. T3_23-1056]